MWGCVEAAASPTLCRHLGKKYPEGSRNSGTKFKEWTKVAAQVDDG